MESINWEELANEVESTQGDSFGGNYEEVPYGDYEVKVEKLEKKVSKTGRMMMYVQFRIVSDKCKNACIFMNQVVDSKGGMGLCLGFLKSLDSGIEIKCPRSEDEFTNMLLDVHEAIDGKLEYALSYDVNKNGFNTFKITEVFEV